MIIIICCLIGTIDFSEENHDGIDEPAQPWNVTDIMNNVTSVHNCVEHQNKKWGIGTAFDSLNREK